MTVAAAKGAATTTAAPGAASPSAWSGPTDEPALPAQEPARLVRRLLRRAEEARAEEARGRPHEARRGGAPRRARDPGHPAPARARARGGVGALDGLAPGRLVAHEPLPAALAEQRAPAAHEAPARQRAWAHAGRPRARVALRGLVLRARAAARGASRPGAAGAREHQPPSLEAAHRVRAARREDVFSGKNPLQDTKKRRVPKGIYETLSAEEAARVLRMVPPQWRGFVAAAIYLALRKGRSPGC
jgi:hypothetical protein